MCVSGRYRLELWIALTISSWLWRPAGAQEQLSSSLGSTISFLDSGLTTLGHMSAFLNALFRGRMDCETVCRETMSKARQKLEIKKGWTEEAFEENQRLGISKDVIVVVGIGKEEKALEFFSHCSIVYGVEPVVVPCSFYSSLPDSYRVGSCSCERCTCLLLHPRSMRATKHLVRLLPGATFRDAHGNHVLPSVSCFQGKCHSMMQPAELQPLHVVNDAIAPGAPASIPTSFAASLMGRMDSLVEGEACVCAPLVTNPESDEWSKALKRMLQTKNDASRGAEGVTSRALARYLDGVPQTVPAEEVFGWLESIAPRLIEAALIAILTLWFRVDGFSSSLVSRRAVRDYVTDEMGNAAHIGLRVQKVSLHFPGPTRQQFSHVIMFRTGPISIVTASLALGTVTTLFSTTWWCISVARGTWIGQWNTAYSLPPTTLRSCLGIAGLLACLLLDCVELWVSNTLSFAPAGWGNWIKYLAQTEYMILAAMLAELLMVVLVLVMIVLNAAHKFGRLIYCFLELLSWAKWLLGSMRLGEFVFSKVNEQRAGKWVYASAFLAAAVMAGIGGQWH
eukprot:c2614_g1_i1 orf=427-2121(+)